MIHLSRKNLLALLVVVLLAGAVAGYAAANDPIRLLVNGTEVQTDTDPVLLDGRVMVPIRVVGEALDAEVHWDAQTNTVSIHHGSSTAYIEEIRAVAPPLATDPFALTSEEDVMAYLQEHEEWFFRVLTVPEAEMDRIDEEEKQALFAHLSQRFSEEVIASHFDFLYEQREDGTYSLRATGLYAFPWDTGDYEIVYLELGRQSEQLDLHVQSQLAYPGINKRLHATVEIVEGNALITHRSQISD